MGDVTDFQDELVTFHDEMTGTLRISQHQGASESGYLQRSDFTRWSLKRADRLWSPLSSRRGFVGIGA